MVEDDTLVRWITADLLQKAGYEVVEAETADAAVMILEERDDIRAILTDVNMPGSMDGLAFAALARDCWPDLRIIIVSGRVRPTAEELPPRTFFLPKPYSADDLNKVLSAL
ncbi:response regulator [Xanthobacteraceae bacterium A53D]